MKKISPYLLLAIFVASPNKAEAYIDPGTGSMILQLVLAGVAGLVVFGRLFWRRVVMLIAQCFPQRSAQPKCPENLQTKSKEIP